jgi:holo-[acyl-carrier protein] synthase
MILGIGSDICEIGRVTDAIAGGGRSFLDRLFTPSEQTRAGIHRAPAVVYAGCFSAKEACAKALGTGITDRVRWTDMEVLATGACTILKLEGGALRRLRRMAARRTPVVHLSIACRDGLVSGFVVIEAR